MVLLTKIDCIVRKCEEKILVFLMACMLVLGLMQVISRFVIQKPIGWSEPMLTYMFVWSCFLGASLAVAHQAHFDVELFVDHMSPKAQKFIGILVQFLIIGFSILMVWKGALLLEANQTQEMAAMPFSMVWPYLAMPVSGLFVIIHSLTMVVKSLQGGNC
jgi:TRAP-type C4-dicarboxylate transport system permease small subunit